jgi:hypothetical protein
MFGLRSCSLVEQVTLNHGVHLAKRAVLPDKLPIRSVAKLLEFRLRSGASPRPLRSHYAGERGHPNSNLLHSLQIAKLL